MNKYSQYFVNLINNYDIIEQKEKTLKYIEYLNAEQRKAVNKYVFSLMNDKQLRQMKTDQLTENRYLNYR